LISIRKTATEMERLEELERAAVECYALAIGSSGQHAVEVDGEQTARLREQLLALEHELRGATTVKQLRRVQTAFDDDLRQYAGQAQELIRRLRRDAEAAAAAVEVFAGDVATNGSSHEKELKRELQSHSEVAASDDIAAIRSGIHAAVGGITASFERMRANNQLAIAQLKDEIRVLHQEVQAVKRARAAGDGEQYDRASIADRIDDLLRRDASFSVLLVVVRNLRAVETSCSKSLVDGALSSLQTRFHRAAQDAAVVGRWAKEQFVAIFNEESTKSVMARSGEVAQNLSRAYILNENGEPRMLTLQVAAGVLNHPARTEAARFYPKLEQLAGTLAL